MSCLASKVCNMYEMQLNTEDMLDGVAHGLRLVHSKERHLHCLNNTY